MKQCTFRIRPPEQTALPLEHILTCCHGDIILLPCGFPVSCLVFLSAVFLSWKHTKVHASTLHTDLQVYSSSSRNAVQAIHVTHIKALILESNILCLKYLPVCCSVSGVWAPPLSWSGRGRPSGYISWANGIASCWRRPARCVPS